MRDFDKHMFGNAETDPRCNTYPTVHGGRRSPGYLASQTDIHSSILVHTPFGGRWRARSHRQRGWTNMPPSPKPPDVASQFAGRTDPSDSPTDRPIPAEKCRCAKKSTQPICSAPSISGTLESDTHSRLLRVFAYLVFLLIDPTPRSIEPATSTALAGPVF